MEQIRRVMRPTDVPDTGAFFWSLLNILSLDTYFIIAMPGTVVRSTMVRPLTKDITGWSENDRGVSFTFGPDVVTRFPTEA